jgi:hypothetical protein
MKLHISYITLYYINKLLLNVCDCIYRHVFSDYRRGLDW